MRELGINVEKCDQEFAKKKRVGGKVVDEE